MAVPFLIASLITAWAMLRIIGGQRHVQMREMEEKVRSQLLADAGGNPPAPADSNPPAPVRSKAAH